MTQEQLQDKCRGSLFGGAVGDALGYPVEFVKSFEDIRAIYGEEGVTDFDLSYPWLDEEFDKALFSDDTQMTLYTAEGLLEAERSHREIVQTICNAYLAWFGHQVGRKVMISYKSDLSLIKELNQRRSPGNTCICSLMLIHNGKEPMNASKGCGGGWVAEETLAISIFSVLRHIGDFNACMISAVNHGGDSDSTGAVAGNIIGAILGFEAIPDKFKDTIQLKELLLSTADAILQN